MKKQTTDNNNNAPTVWVVTENAWGSICGIYSTKELAHVALQVLDKDALTKHTVTAHPLVGETVMSPIDHPELDLDV